MQWIEHGVSFEFAHPLSEVQKRHARFKERLQLVRALLSKTTGAGSVDGLLDGL